MNSNWSQTKWASSWVTATLAVAMVSMALVLTQQRRRRVLVDNGHGVTAGSHVDTFVSGSHRPAPHRRTRALNNRNGIQSGNRVQSTVKPGTTASNLSYTGLQLGHGIWDFVLVPFVSECICLLGGCGAIYLTQCNHLYYAIALVVTLFFFRLKSTAFTASYAPLTESSKLHLLQSLDSNTLHELLQEDLPRWVKYPDIEKCEWLNQLIATLWPYVKVAAARSVREALKPTLESIKPKLLMTELGFIGLDLGTAAPMINGVKSQKHLEEEVVIDIDVLIATQNSDVVFSFGNPASHVNLTVELSDFLLRGTLRVVLKPLFPRWPTVGAIAVSFTERPTINFHLKTLYVNIMEIPALSSIFHKAIRSAVESKLVWPNKILIPLVKDLSNVEMDALAANKPLGMLIVKNLRLSGVQPINAISRWTGLFRFHVQLHVGKERVITETVQGQTAFDFGEDQAYYLLVLDPKTQDLNLSLEYKETLHSFRQIDSKWIHLDHLAPRVDSTEVVSFGRNGVGRAEFELIWYPFSDPFHMQQQSSEEVPLPLEIAQMGAVFITLHNCEQLLPMDYNGTSDPYVIFRVGSHTVKSSIKERTLNPFTLFVVLKIWDPPEHFEMLVTNNRHDKLNVIVMDRDFLTSDDEISRVDIPLAQLQRSARLKQTWKLENDSGSITLNLEWRGF